MESLTKFTDQSLSKESMLKIRGGDVTRLLCQDVNSGSYNYYFYNNETGSFRNLLGVSVSLCDVQNCGCGPQL